MTKSNPVITKEMIEAGVDKIAGYSSETESAEATVEDIFLAMFKKMKTKRSAASKSYLHVSCRAG